MNKKSIFISLALLSVFFIKPENKEAHIYKAQVQTKPWGHEVIFAAVEGKYVGKVIHVKAGQSLSLQYHNNKEETISILYGEAILEYGNDIKSLKSVPFMPGDTVHVPTKVIHRIKAISDVTFVESSTAELGWRDDVVRLEDKYGREGTCKP